MIALVGIASANPTRIVPFLPSLKILRPARNKKEYWNKYPTTSKVSAIYQTPKLIENDLQRLPLSFSSGVCRLLVNLSLWSNGWKGHMYLTKALKSKGV